MNEVTILTPKELAERLKVTVPTIYRWVRLSGLPCLRADGARSVRFIWSEVLEWLNKRSETKDRLLTVGELAGHLNVSENTIYRWIKSGLPHYRKGPSGWYRFRLEEVLEWLSEETGSGTEFDF